MNNEKVIVSSDLNIYCFVKRGENGEKELLKANRYLQDQLIAWTENNKNYPSEFAENRIKEYSEKTYSIMLYDDFLNYERETLLSKPAIEITEEQFNDSLNVLPPLKWCTMNGVNQFLMSEFYTGTYTTQYARKNNKYYCKMVDAYDQKTWLHNIL